MLMRIEIEVVSCWMLDLLGIQPSICEPSLQILPAFWIVFCVAFVRYIMPHKHKRQRRDDGAS